MQLSCYHEYMIDTCLQKLESGSFRQTETRRVILTILHETSGPLTPPDILAACHQAGRKANKTTIYRDLEAMEHAGIVRRVMLSDRAQYFELTERGHHHHFVCTHCHKIQDVTINDENLVRQARRMSEKLEFMIAEHAVEFYGLCRSCQTAKEFI